MRQRSWLASEGSGGRRLLAVFLMASGPSLATELGVLLPTVNGEPGTGLEALLIISQSWDALTLHLNGAIARTRGGDRLAAARNGCTFSLLTATASGLPQRINHQCLEMDSVMKGSDHALLLTL